MLDNNGIRCYYPKSFPNEVATVYYVKDLNLGTNQIAEKYFRQRFLIDCRKKQTLLWFCFTTLPDWLKKLASFSQPMRNKTKPNGDLLALIFPRLAPVA